MRDCFPLDRMSDATDLIEQRLVAPDADGGDQLVDEGGVATLLKDKTLPNHEISANLVIKCGHFDNKIDMTGMKSLDGTKVDNTRPQVGRVVSPDDSCVNV